MNRCFLKSFLYFVCFNKETQKPEDVKDIKRSKPDENLYQRE